LETKRSFSTSDCLVLDGGARTRPPLSLALVGCNQNNCTKSHPESNTPLSSNNGFDDTHLSTAVARSLSIPFSQ